MALRARVLRRDRGRCRKCHAPATEVHHVKPLHLGGDNRMSNLVALCHACHAKQPHRKRRDNVSADWRRYLETLR